MEQKELLTVIVADDETELREAVCSVIPWKEIGFRLVGSAGNGLDALQLVEQLQPDLLLTDILEYSIIFLFKIKQQKGCV